MLTQGEKLSGYADLKEVISEVTSESSFTYAQDDFEVHALVNGARVFFGTANCEFQIDHHDGKVSVYWEDAGLENFKEKGLFGRMSTGYQRIKKLPEDVLEIVGLEPPYQVLIHYKKRNFL